ncbi:hypothetical protein KFL_003690060 [Klebsormidium nitens]|uniref:Nucleotide-diphospho-sugar transferase domain-containing protein n=1 Tax=Klebsormidium nitens TaxID=105231 RepID=A0A1Y1I9M8_KLENI|nr:hypothetical protein KFL_003690060 [Klebsormidium nitens]|eukprot:GAQ87675.1 hypothetical protein KFL_003690060 [Klebsormidium nitens]
MGEVPVTEVQHKAPRGKLQWRHLSVDAKEALLRGGRVSNLQLAILMMILLCGVDILMRGTLQCSRGPDVSQRSGGLALAGFAGGGALGSSRVRSTHMACPLHCVTRDGEGRNAVPIQLPCQPVACTELDMGGKLDGRKLEGKKVETGSVLGAREEAGVGVRRNAEAGGIGGAGQELERAESKGGSLLASGKLPERMLPRRIEEPSLSDTPIFFLATDPDPYSIVCMKLARIYSPKAPLYVITTRYAVAHARFHELLHLPNVRFKMLEHYVEDGSDSSEFYKDYIHQSVTQIKFERLCFFRYFVIREICREEAIQRFLYMDGDVALFSDVSKFAAHDVDLLALTTHSGFFSLWRLSPFERFCEYMAGFYKRDRELVYEDINRNGMKMNETFVQFSDMFMMFSWWQQHQADFSWKFLVHDSKKFQDGFFEYWPMMNLQNIIGWDCLEEDYRQKMEWREDEQGKPMPHFNGTTFPGLHFQGFYCKNLSRFILDPIIDKWLPVRTHSSDPGLKIASPLQRYDLNPGLPPSNGRR